MKDEQTWLKEALQDKDLQMAIMATAGCGWSSYLAEGELPFYPKGDTDLAHAMERLLFIRQAQLP